MATLPGIDPNDQGKTNATLKFYYAVLNCVPLYDVSDIAISADNEYEIFPLIRLYSSLFRW